MTEGQLTLEVRENSIALTDNDGTTLITIPREDATHIARHIINKADTATTLGKSEVELTIGGHLVVTTQQVAIELAERIYQLRKVSK
jgi:hypothetical protein